MSQTLAPSSRTTSRFLALYLLFWAVLAGVAVAYLAVVAARPELLAGLAPTRESASLSPTGKAADVTALRESISQVQLEMARVKTEIHDHDDRLRVLSDRVAEADRSTSAVPAASNQTVPPADASSDVRPQPANAAGLTPAEAKSDQPAERRDLGELAHLGETALLNGSRAAASTLETGSIKPPKETPVAFGPATVKPAAGPVGMQIATAPSVDALRLAWSLLAESHADTLKNLEPRYVIGAGDVGGPTYDLIAGPIKNTAEARRRCKLLATHGVDCKVSQFNGNAL